MNIESNDLVYSYIHGEAGNSATIIKLSLEDEKKKNLPKVMELAKDLALHLVAFKPDYISKDKIPQEYIDENKLIFKKQLEDSGKTKGKSEEIVEKMLTGKLQKHLQEISFLSQPFVKDDKNTVEQIISSISKELETKIEVAEYFIY